MALVRAAIKQGFLRSLYRAVQAQNGVNPSGPPVATLAEALNAFQDTGFTAIKSGRLVIASAGAGHSVTFAPPDVMRGFTQENVFELAEELQQVYLDASVTASSQGPVTDSAIFAIMMADDRLTSVTSTQRDFTVLRWPSRY